MTGDGQPSILLTGATGFVGSRLAARLGSTCRGLVRRAPAGGVSWHPVVGDLLEPAGWAASLAGIGTVVHLAALTGKGRAREHQRVNEEGTRCLVKACEEKGVSRLIFVSSIAVRYPDIMRYPYARAKKRAEEIVQGSGLAHVVVRPTMVLGAGSPILEALQRLSSLRLMPVFGDGRTPVQPVHVDDLVRMLARLVRDTSFDGSVIEIGGPEKLSIEDLMCRIRDRNRDHSKAIVHVPLGLVLPLVALGETVAFDWMPFTTGQVATFRFDGTAASGYDELMGDGKMRDVDAMIAD